MNKPTNLIEELLQRFDEKFGKQIMIVTYADQIKQGTWKNNKDIKSFLRTEVTAVVKKACGKEDPSTYKTATDINGAYYRNQLRHEILTKFGIK